MQFGIFFEFRQLQSGKYRLLTLFCRARKLHFLQRVLQWEHRECGREC